MGYQPSSASSEQNAGPMAIIGPQEPGVGGSAMFDRFPLTRNGSRGAIAQS